MVRKTKYPLRVSHRSYITSLNTPQHHEVWKQFGEHFWQNTAALPPEQMEFLFLRGFLRDKWVLYALHDSDCELYLSDVQAALLRQANDLYAPVIEDRMLMSHALSGYFTVPKIHALRGWKANEIGLSAEWQAHADAHPAAPPLEIMIQPLRAGAPGRSARVSLRDGQFSGFGTRGNLEHLSAIVRDWSKASGQSYLFSETLPQDAALAPLFPRGRSHLSILLTRDLKDWTPRIVAACAVIDSTRAAAADSLRLSDGALSAPVSLSTGVLGPALGLADGQMVAHRKHPDTGARIDGLRLPGWTANRATLERMMDECSYLRLAFLNVSIQRDGTLALLGPADPDLSVLQVHRPLLGDPVLAETLRKTAL